VRENPRRTAVEIAAEAKVTRQRAHQILHDLGYELVTYWRKAKGGRP